MDRVFSVGEISEQFWSNPPDASSKMNRSESEWAFQRFLQEAQQPTSSGDSKNDSVVEIKSAHISNNNNNNNNNTDNQNDNVKAGGGGGNVSKAATSALSFDGTQNLEDYQAVLKSKLNLACAAVALSRVSFFFFCVFVHAGFVWLVGKLTGNGKVWVLWISWVVGLCLGQVREKVMQRCENLSFH